MSMDNKLSTVPGVGDSCQTAPVVLITLVLLLLGIPLILLQRQISLFPYFDITRVSNFTICLRSRRSPHVINFRSGLMVL